MATKKKSEKLIALVVLNDGETFTDARGCSILIVKDSDYKKAVITGMKADEIPAVMEVGIDCVGFTNASC